MSEYLTKQSPSWRNWVLSKLGWTDLPTPVTCWYCNQKMYLLPGSRHTERLWYCNLCENTNAIDEFGDIMDAPPLPETGIYSGYGSSLAQRRKDDQSMALAKPSSDRTLCHGCQRNQTLIYQIMSDYIRDESDPDYDYYVKTADEYQQSLHNKYPLCDVCQEKIQVIVAEQRGSFRRRRINEQRQRSLQSKTPTRLTSLQYQLHGSLWFTLHGSVLILCIFVIYYPPQPLETDMTIGFRISKWIAQAGDAISTVMSHRMDDDQHTVISLMSPSSSQPSYLRIVFDAMVTALWYIKSDFQNMILFIGDASYALFTLVAFTLLPSTYTAARETPLPEEHPYSWNVKNMGVICYLLFYTLSIYFMNWHTRASRTFLELSKPRHLKTYISVQRFLYCYRFAFLYSLAFMTTSRKTSLWSGFACSYIMLLLWSVLNVQLKKSRSSEWPERIVGKSEKAQQPHSEPAQSGRLPHLSPIMSSKSKLPPSSSPRSAKSQQQYRELKEQPRPAWYHPRNFIFKHHHLDSRDAEVDGLTAELGKISV
ncbi:Ima1 N-terminal domain-domain-containing protein [Absidia repens]|uniref:Ima1 N-terminal domain-domain-containing protein n=1 Tax=Absidia repens TaxID=90262 RepID=A0A1X2HWZ2_9FUNG|nr:Ima1 N-terminal domain-domain-containing protein [Absidia repens]